MKRYAFIERWIMRVKEARTVETLALWGIMAVTQVLDYVQPFTSTRSQIYIAASMVVFFGIVFPYIYDKFGLMKGEQRQRIRRKEAFIGENMLLNQLGVINIVASATGADKDEMMNEYRKFVRNNHDGITVREFIESMGERG